VTAPPAAVTASPTGAPAPPAAGLTSPAGPAGPLAASAGGAASVPAPLGSADHVAPDSAALDRLAQQLYGRLRGRLADELRADRERAQLLTDL